MLDELLAAPAGIHGHAEQQVDLVDGVDDRLGGRRRRQRQAGQAAGLTDGLERVVHVRRRLLVDRDDVGAGLGERLHLALGALNHQVDVEDRAGAVHLVGQRADDGGPERDRRHEVAVHDVAVDDPRAGVEHLGDLLAQVGEVGRQDRRRDPLDAQDLRLHRPQPNGGSRL